MSKKEISILCFQILGVLSFLFAISNINFITVGIQSIKSESLSSVLIVLSFIPFISFIAVGIYLIKNSEKISELIFPFTESEKKGTTLSSIDIQNIAFSIVGIFILAQAIPSFFKAVSNFFYLIIVPYHSSFNPFKYRLIGDFTGVILKLVLGSYLFLQSEGISKLWHKIKEAKGMNFEK